MSPCSPLPHGKPPIAIAIAIGYLRPPSLSTAKNNILLPELLEFASVKRAREQKGKRDPSHEEMGFGPSDQFQDMFLYYIYIYSFIFLVQVVYSPRALVYDMDPIGHPARSPTVSKLKLSTSADGGGFFQSASGTDVNPYDMRGTKVCCFPESNLLFDSFFFQRVA